MTSSQQKKAKIRNIFLHFISFFRSLFRILPVLIALVVLVLIFFLPQLDGHSLLLRYIAAILSWPSVVIVAILVFHRPLSGKIQDLLKIGGRGYSIEWSEQKEVASPVTPETIMALDKPTQTFVYNLVQEVVFLLNNRFIYQTQVELLFKIFYRGFVSYEEAIEAYKKYLSYGGPADYSPERYFGWLISGQLLVSDIQANVRGYKLAEIGDAYVRYLLINKFTFDEFRRW